MKTAYIKRSATNNQEWAIITSSGKIIAEGNNQNYRKIAKEHGYAIKGEM